MFGPRIWALVAYTTKLQVLEAGGHVEYIQWSTVGVVAVVFIVPTTLQQEGIQSECMAPRGHKPVIEGGGGAHSSKRLWNKIYWLVLYGSIPPEWMTSD